MLIHVVPQSSAGIRTEQEWMGSAIRIQARRHWIVRTAAMLIVSACALLLLVFAQRDRATRGDLMRSMQTTATALQAQANELGQLPAQLPDVPSRVAIAYASDLVREYAHVATGPVIVASGPRTRLILQSDGCPVILYEHGKVTTAWWSRAKLLGEWIDQEQHIKAWDQQRKMSAPRLP